MVRAATGKTPGKSGNHHNGKTDIFKSGIVILIFVVGMLGYYYYLSNRASRVTEENVKLTVAQELINRNLSYTYPPSPREVIKFYSDITKCFYNETYSGAELEQLAEQTYRLYDEKLKDENDWNAYLVNLTVQINAYKEKNMRISSYFLPSSDDVVYYNRGEEKYAKMPCSYIVQSGSHKRTVDEIFVLHKDEEGHWRILGWQLADEDAGNTEEN